LSFEIIEDFFGEKVIHRVLNRHLLSQESGQFELASLVAQM